MAALLHVADVHKRFGKLYVLRGINIDIAANEIICLLGPNGSGKTTFLKILSGLMFPDEGDIRINGEVFHPDRDAARWIGWMPGEDRSFYGRLTGWENLRFFGSLQGFSSAQIRSRIDEIAQIIPVADILSSTYQKHSAGMRQRLALIRALLHQPQILLLDEPTRSLDPENAEHVRQFVQNWTTQQGHAAIWATHNVNEAFRMSKSIQFFREGSVIFNSTKEDMISRYPGRTPDDIYLAILKSNDKN